MNKTLCTLLLLASGLAVAQQQQPVPDQSVPMINFVQRADATELAKKYAANIQDQEECDRFRDEIMSYAKGNPYDGRTVAKMTGVLRKASAVGCRK